jgi:hypothetical protein
MSKAALALTDRRRLKTLVFDRYDDWSGVLGALQERRLTISQTALERFFNGRSDSRRTLRSIATLLHTTPDALLNHTRLASPASRTTRSAAPLQDPEAFRVAYQLWIEMTTRKLGLPIDLRHDLVADLYDSWYAFFKLARELIKTIPLHRNPASQEMRRLVELSRAVLNEGMRPHLEQWQARFRVWLAAGGNRALAPGLAPQEMQSQFPEWTALSRDLQAANQRLGGYLTSLEAMIARPRLPKRKKSRSHSA